MASHRSAFISYARDDWAFADLIENYLRDASFDVARDVTVLHAGEWDPALSAAIRRAQVVILIVTKRSIQSDHVLHECMIAMIAGIPLVAVQVNDVDIKELPRFIKRLNLVKIDSASPDKKKWKPLLDALDDNGGLNRIADDIAPPYKLLGVAEDLHKFIVEFVKGSDELIVVTDFVGYGNYTDPAVAAKYRDNLVVSRNSNTLKMAVYGFTEPSVASRSRASIECERLFNFDTDKKTPKFKAYYTVHAKTISQGRKDHSREPAADKETFIRDVCNVERFLRSKLLKKGIVLTEVNSHLNFFLWVKPSEAIFSLPELGDPDKELVFWTSDLRIVIPLRDMARKYLTGNGA
jgi:hypothetical protein